MVQSGAPRKHRHRRDRQRLGDHRLRHAGNFSRDDVARRLRKRTFVAIFSKTNEVHLWCDIVRTDARAAGG